MAKQTERVTKLQEKVQAFFDAFPQIPIMFIEQTLELSRGTISTWITRGKLVKPTDLAVGHGWKYDGVIKRDQPGKPTSGRKPYVKPEKKEPRGEGVVVKPQGPPPEKDLFAELPDYSVDELRQLVKKQMGKSITDAKEVSSYAQALKALMDINVKQLAMGLDGRETMHSYVPLEDLGPDDE